MKKKVKKKSSLNKDIKNSLLAKRSLLKIEKKIKISIDKIFEKISNGGRIYLCGNGGSAADAQHFAAEFLIRLRPKINRKPLPALTLATDTSTITACGNDYSFDKIFSRNLEALGTSKDVLIAISTSGNSKNILNVLKIAKKKSILSIGFFGNRGGKAKNTTDISLIVNSKTTARIQEAHIFLGHHILEQLENRILSH